MKVSKASQEFANRVFRLCQDSGALSESKLQKALKFLESNKPNDYRGVLIGLKRLVRLDVEKRTVNVESARELPEKDAERIKKSIAKKHGENLIYSFSLNEDLIGGLKIKVGSQVYDSSVLSKINRLSNSL